MKKEKLRSVGLFVVLILVGCISACKKERVAVAGKSKVRFVNAYFNSDPQELYQNDLKLTPSAIAYGAYGAYSEVSSGRSTFWSNDVVENKATSIVDAILYNDYAYTLFYCDTKDSKPIIVGYINEERAVPAGKFRVRFVNLSVAFNDVPLVVTGSSNNVINAELNYGDNPVYNELSVNNEIKVNIKDNNVFTVLDKSKFQEGKSYLVWFDTSNGLEVEYHVVPQN